MNIFFCFPHKEVGGVSIVFLKLSKALSMMGYEIYLIDYKDGYMASRKDKNVNFLEYRDDKSVIIPSDSLIIFQSMTPWSIFPSLDIHPDVKIFFWNCHPFNLVPTLPGIRKKMQSSLSLGRLILKSVLRPYRSKIVTLIYHLTKTNALIFMDKTNLKTTEDYLDVKVSSPIFLPIPLKEQSEIMYRGFDRSSRKIKIAWIGRIVDFKYFILKRALIDINSEAKKMNDIEFEVSIIGEGLAKDKLIREVEKLSNISINFINYINPEDIPKFLASEVDLFMAMGTSALEGARIGIPTILLDISYNNVNLGYKYEWLSDRDGFSLGDVINDNHFSKNNNSLAEKLYELIENAEQQSLKTKSYYDQNHSIELVSHKFIDLLFKSSCRWKAIQDLGLAKRGILYYLFTLIRRKYKSL